MTLDALIGLLRLTLANPRAAAAQLKALNLPASAGWTALVLMSVVSAGTGVVGFLLAPGEMDPGLDALFGSPLRTALVQLGALALTGVLAHWVGARFGGRGTLPQALVLVAWAQLPPILLQLVQIVAMLVLPGLAPLIGLAGFALYVVLLSLFIAELHGFRSGIVVFFGMFAVSFLVAVVAAMLFAALIGVPHV